MKRIIPYILLLMYLSGCLNTGKKVNVNEYIRWYEHNKSQLTVKKEINSINYILQYIPVDFLVLRNYMEKSIVCSPESISNTIKQVKQQFFTLQIGPSRGTKHILYYNLKNRSEYEQRVNYYSFGIKDDLLLVEGKDTLQCIDSHFERTYGLTPYITLNLIFPKLPHNSSKNIQDIQLLFNDLVFNNGKIKLTISKETLKKIPLLNNDNNH